MKSKQTIGVAFLGLGRMGETHLRNLGAISGVRVVVVADPQAERAERGRVMSGAESALTEPEKAIEHPGVDAVVIVTPTDTHARLIEVAANAGKAVFSEKPIALDLSETQRVVRLVQERNVPVQLGFMRRYDPGYAKAKAKIEAGELGKLETFRALSRDTYPPGLEFLLGSGGLFLDMSVHDFDLLIGSVLGSYRGYDPTVNAQVTEEFSTAAFRMGHSEVSDTQEGIDANGNVVFTESLAPAFFNTPEIDESNGIDPLLRSLGADFSQATDAYVVAALRNLLFAGLVGGDIDEMDLIAIDIQREKDVGLGTLNQTRQAIGLRKYTSFAQLTSDPVLQKNLQAVYVTIDNVDLFMGGLAEKHAAGAIVGPTFQAIIADQFQALRAGDRFFWQNEGFDPQTAAMIGKTTLTNIIQRNTATPSLQANVFVESALPTHVRPHATQPAVIDTHGRKVSPFLNDGN